MFDVSRTLAAQGFQAVLQQEHAYQVARRRGGEKMRDRAGLGFEGRRAVGSESRPQIDDRVGCGVVVTARLRGNLRSESTAHKGSGEG